MKRLLFLLFTFYSVLSFSQTIEGLVKGEDTDSPIEYGIVSLLDSDSLIIAGTLTDSLGYFKLDAIPEGTYTLKVAFVGYKELSISVEMNDNHYDFDPLYLKRDEDE